MHIAVADESAERINSRDGTQLGRSDVVLVGEDFGSANPVVSRCIHKFTVQCIDGDHVAFATPANSIKALRLQISAGRAFDDARLGSRNAVLAQYCLRQMLQV